MYKKIYKILILLIISMVVLGIDQLTKMKIIDLLYQSAEHEIKVTWFFKLVLVFNHGISFGIFNDASQNQMVLIGLASAIILVLLYWYRQPINTITMVAISLIIGGAIGNIIDRLLYQAVVDFLDFHYKNYHYPAFNVADSAVVIGAFLIIWQSFYERKTNLT